MRRKIAATSYGKIPIKHCRQGLISYHLPAVHTQSKTVSQGPADLLLYLSAHPCYTAAVLGRPGGWAEPTPEGCCPWLCSPRGSCPSL